MTDKLEYEDNEVGEPTSRIARIVWFIRQEDRKGDILVTEVEAELGFDLRRYRQQLEANWELRGLGYQYEAGAQGRGNASKFKWIGDD
jgi:hypothetical protein